jgi:hypothetical protein
MKVNNYIIHYKHYAPQRIVVARHFVKIMKQCHGYVGFEVLTAVSTKMAVFWVAAPLPDYTALQPRRQPSSFNVMGIY